MHIETIPLDIGRRRQILFELNEPVTLSAEEYEEIKPWVSNWYTNEKANSYAPRFNTQRTNYRCIFHAQKASEPAGKGLRARSTRQPLEKPCPFTMGVVAHYAKDGKSVVRYTIDRTSIHDRCPDHTHDIEMVDKTRRCDGLRAIAYHRMSLMAPDAKANLVFHSMKELPRYEEAGGKYFTNSEVYHVGREFRKPTDAVASKPGSDSPSNPTSTSNSNPPSNPATNTTSEAEGQAEEDGIAPPPWASFRKRKRVPDVQAPHPRDATIVGRYRPATMGLPCEENRARNLEIMANGGDIQEYYRQHHPPPPRQPRQPSDETLERRERLYGNTPPGDIASRVREILSRPSGAAPRPVQSNGGYSPAPVDLTSPGGYEPPPNRPAQPHTWRSSHPEPQPYGWRPSYSEPQPHQSSNQSNMILPTWMTANEPTLLQTRSVQVGRSAVVVEAPVSIGDLLRKAVPENAPSQPITPHQTERHTVALPPTQPVVNERATLRELLSMQQPSTPEVDRERFPPNPFS
ncbi:hypothetical protein D6C76_04647 [Aureobasidium pullulans]|nr:hypothetical protein D6C76_04647 [Aureobasidium pullulans]